MKKERKKEGRKESDMTGVEVPFTHNFHKNKYVSFPLPIIHYHFIKKRMCLAQYRQCIHWSNTLLSGVPDYFGRNKISSGGDLSHYSSASLY